MNTKDDIKSIWKNGEKNEGGKMCKLSVIIPVYNAEKYLERCLDSVVNQTLKDIEIICVDDCSPDNSLEILNRYAKNDSRIKIIRHAKNGGESAARNTGLDNAIGDYIAFVDNDDIIDLDFYERLYDKAIETNADVTKAESYAINYEGKKDSHHIDNKKIEENKFYFTTNWWTAIYKKSLIKDNNLRLPVGFLISGDIIFLIRSLVKANKVATINGTYYCHYDREDSGFSKELSNEKVQRGIDAIKIILNELNENKIFNENPNGYNYVFKDQFTIIINLIIHTFNEANLKTLIELMHYLIDASNLKSELLKELDLVYPEIVFYLNNNNDEYLLKYFKTNHDRKSICMSNVRFKIQNRKGTINA